jgi:hypothetical protein
MAVATPSNRRSPLVVRVLAVPLVAAVLLAGSVLVVGQLLPGNFWIKIALSVVWFIAAGAVLRRIAERTSPDLRLPFRIAVIAAGLVLAGWYANSWRPNKVEDTLVSAPDPAAGAAAPSSPGPRLLGRGQLHGIGHRASGTAEIVETGGKVLVQLRDFDVQPGPDYRLYLANAEKPDGGRALGALKGTSGNQRYVVEHRADARRYRVVLVWCRAFSVPVAAATLR